MKKSIFIFSLLLHLISQSQTQIYSEDFTGQNGYHYSTTAHPNGTPAIQVKKF